MEEAVSFLFCIGGRIESTYIDDKFWSERARMLLTLAARQSCIIIIHALRGFAHRLKAFVECIGSSEAAIGGGASVGIRLEISNLN